MASAQLFSGTWLIEVLCKEAAFSERFVIEGSTASDGIYAGEVTTTPIVVTGPRWLLRFEWNNNVGSGWQPSDIRRTGGEFTLAGGLITILGADDNVPALRDHDFNDLVLRCRNLDPRAGTGARLGRHRHAGPAHTGGDRAPSPAPAGTAVR